MNVLASTALLLLAASPASAGSPAQALRLQEGLPAGFKVDGKLDEWKQPPSVTLDAASQVAGKSKVSSPQDLSAQLWVALGPEGLAVAGEVHDDHVQLSASPAEVNNDHVEVWLALPQPKMPPIAFVNQFGDHELPTAAACDNKEEVQGDPVACRRWREQQVDHRKQLVRAFTVQYGLMSSGVVRFDQKGAVGSAHYEPMAGGYRFEALIPLAAFPRSAEAPLRTLKVLVDLVDSDEGTGKQESFLSSSKTRRFGDPSTFHAVKLAQPLHFGAWPELLERAVKENEKSSVQPAPDAHVVEVWANPAVGYQYSPEQLSPAQVQLDLSKEKIHGKLGDVEVLTVPAHVNEVGSYDYWLISRRGKALLDVQASGTTQLRVAPKPPGLHILEVSEGPRSALGTGECGSCAELSFSLTKMDAQGHFSKPEPMEGASSQGEELTWTATPDLSRIEASHEAEEGTPRHLAVRYTWNAKKGSYTQENFKQPSGQDSAPPNPPTAPKAAGCSASTLSPEPAASATPLPPAVESMRRRIVAAAVACDYEKLAALAREKNPDFSFTLGPETNPAAAWREREEKGDPVLALLVKALNLPLTRLDTLYIWPSAYNIKATDADWNALKGMYSAEEIKQLRDFPDGYIGFRTGIDKSGDWQFALSGD
jgi:hypothetical protein